MPRFRLAHLFLVVSIAALLAWTSAPWIKQWLKPPIETQKQMSSAGPFFVPIPHAKWANWAATIDEYRALRIRMRDRRAARLVPATAEQAIAEELALAQIFGESLSDPDMRRAFMSPEEVRAREIERRHMIRKEMSAAEQRTVQSAP